MKKSAKSSNSANNSRKTSTISDNTPLSNITPENTVLTTKDIDQQSQQLSATPTTALDSNQVKASPVHKVSRFLISPTVVPNENNELVVQEGSYAETELHPQQSIGIRMSIFLLKS
jgi:hypothetical protein